MHIGRTYPLHQSIIWTRREIVAFLVLGAIPTVLHKANIPCFVLPWLPIAAIATAVAFITGFKNNASYNRLWEARKIWGAIVNGSRAWAIDTLDLLVNVDKETKTRLIRRHMAWITALRYQLRTPKPWETIELAHNKEYRRYYEIPERDGKLEENLCLWLDKDEVTKIMSKQNAATHLLASQAADLADLRKQGKLEEYTHVKLSQRLDDFYVQQGKCERIKNFPYPRQFATLNYFFIWLFVALVPFGMVAEFAHFGDTTVWLAIPLSALVSWVFHTMEKIGSVSENPFEGGSNDVPITSISRTIEIDLREMMGESNPPPAIAAKNDIVM